VFVECSKTINIDQKSIGRLKVGTETTLDESTLKTGTVISRALMARTRTMVALFNAINWVDPVPGIVETLSSSLVTSLSTLRVEEHVPLVVRVLIGPTVPIVLNFGIN
jgi:hypothetical protein